MLLGRVGGVRVAVPPKRLLGRFTRPGMPEACAAWLLETAPTADAVVVGLDMLAYGGIVASRSAARPLRAALTSLESLRRLRQTRPRLPMLGVSLIRRLGTTVTSVRSAQVHADLVRVSEFMDRVERLGQTSLAGQLEAARRRLPSTALDEYLATRRRNHQVNRAAVALVAEGVLDYLILAQEDALPVGPHIAEQRALRDAARTLGVGGRVAIHPGADEAGLTLLARAVCGLHGWRPRVAACYSRPRSANTVALFEDRPIWRTVRGHIAAVGGLRAASARRADLELLVHTPRGRQAYPTLGAASVVPGAFVRRVGRAAAAGRAVVADVAYCNGADPALAAALVEAGSLADLAGYAGWNTAGNTLGTALAHGALRQVAVAEGAKAAERTRRDLAHYTFLLHRLTDDCRYQSEIRPRAVILAERLGASRYRIGRGRTDLARFVREEVEAQCREDFERIFRGRALAGGARLDEIRGVTVRLPWSRLFEVALVIRLAASGRVR